MKQILISENTERDIVWELLSESFAPSREKTLLVKDYLDKNFTKKELDDIDSNGYPTTVKVVYMVNSSGMPLKTLSIGELLSLLDDKFHKIITDDSDRKKFLKQVIKDWYIKKISKDGILSVNYIK